MSSLRFKLIILSFLIIFAVIVAKLFSWQVLNSSLLSVQARDQYQGGSAVSAPRGNILASDGGWLAASDPAWLLWVSFPDLTDSSSAVANKLAPLLVDSSVTDQNYQSKLADETNTLQSLLEKKGLVWLPLAHKISSDVKRNIEALKIKGIGFDPEEKRAYPEASSAAQLLGFVGKDSDGKDKGYFGLEGFYDLTLSGKPGFVSQEKDAKGAPIVLDSAQQVSAISGVNLATHIDKTIQNILETSLSAGIAKYGAKGGTVVVMDPKTGAIVGMASQPSYDPATYWQYTNELFKNPAISDTFEPGSIFKVLVMAAGLDSGVVKPDTICDICDGPLKVDKYYIETWDQKYHPDSIMTDVIVNSDNVGMSFVGQKLGADKLYDYLNSFGIGDLSGIDLQGEVTAKLREKGTWNIVDLATTSFGQGVAVTPIQMVRAVSVIANGGKLITPHVVSDLEGDGWKESIGPQIGPQIISTKTANEVTAMMVSAATNGESKWARISGFKVAGKTGTAQIPIAGHYDTKKTIGSFIGFAPADDPKFVMLVTLREPSSSTWASETAAPLWYDIAKDLFPYLGIQPTDGY